MKDIKKNLAFLSVFWMAFLTSLSVIFVTALQWFMFDQIMLFLLTWLAYLVVVFWSVIYFIRNRKKWRVALLPLLVCAITFSIVTLAPFRQLSINHDFVINKSSREDIVRKILNGTLQPNVGYNSSLIALPKNAPQVSHGGNEIVVEDHNGKKYVFFFMFRGIIDNYSGFLYVPKGGNPTMYSDFYETGNTDLEKLDEHWFFASHT